MAIPMAIHTATPRATGWGVAPTKMLPAIPMAIPMATPRASGWGVAPKKLPAIPMPIPMATLRESTHSESNARIQETHS